jgi:hypothetical protein
VTAIPAADGLWFAGFAEPPEGPLRYIRARAALVAAVSHLPHRSANARSPEGSALTL